MSCSFLIKKCESTQLKARFTNYGARLMSLEVPNNTGGWVDIVLGFSSPAAYVAADEPYYGATVGRYANRIAAAHFDYNGKTYFLEKNSPWHSLHGGTKGWHNQTWDIVEHHPSYICFQLISEAGEMGFPGEAHAQVTYRLVANTLEVSYEVRTDQTCPINLTHHSYFNLAGEGNGDVLQHILTLPATHYTPLNEQMIPTGEYAPVAHTPFDFRAGKTIGQDLQAAHPQIQLAGGFDHNFVLKRKDDPTQVHAATVLEPTSGRSMKVYTNQPGLQLYVGNGLSGKDIGKSGVSYNAFAGFCLECQHFPNTPNTPHFPSCWVAADEIYAYQTHYVFE